MATATVSLNTAQAQGVKLRFLLAAAEGQGDLTSLLAWADWLEENGSVHQAAMVRLRAQVYAGRPGLTLHGETWLLWYVRYELGLIADSLARQSTAFRSFAYRGDYDKDGSMYADDGSMEWALARGYVPTLHRRSKRQARLGQIIEALGYRVFYGDVSPGRGAGGGLKPLSV